MTHRPNKRIQVNVIGRYRKETAVIKAAVKSTLTGREYLDITPRQVKVATDKCCYAGSDVAVLENVNGYSDWQLAKDNGFVAYKIGG